MYVVTKDFLLAYLHTQHSLAVCVHLARMIPPCDVSNVLMNQQQRRRGSVFFAKISTSRQQYSSQYASSW